MFFSVKSSIKIAGKVYSPCICYEAKEVLAPTIEKLAKDGKARIHEERVYFQNGKILEKKVVVEEKPKKTKKEKAVPAVDTVEEDIPSPEEIADNEDF